ncbi:hypothetical protein J437_LFUL006371 [Ladona fulva]|uniref:Uncharacterized protein n=1 Tax=Ladona fulva TaxID=123851 RepID=A0A8K0K1S4_LADFU|nr:hypothetical protein J437_LFUL006371 [Ladona fulva]
MVADALSSSGHLLALSACLRKSSSLFLASDSSTSQSMGTPLHLLVHRWLPAVTLMENIEAKVPLLWAHALLLAQNGHGNEVSAVSEEALQILASSLINVGNCQEGIFSGFLGTIGLKKRVSPSIRFKIFCTAVAAFLYAYLEGKEVHGSRLKDAQNSVEKICKRHKEFNEVATIFNSTVMKPNLSLKHGNELIEKLLGRLYFEKRCYVQCIY